MLLSVIGVFFIIFLSAPWSFAKEDFSSRFIYQDYSKRISMDFKDAALIDVLKIFSKQSGKNFIAAKDIGDKKVTLFFDDVPIEDALNQILDANGLMYSLSKDESVFIVKEKVSSDSELITKVFPLKYATVSTSKINSTISISGSSGSSSSSSSGGSGSSGGGLIAAVQAVISKEGTVVEDPRTNSIIVRDAVSQFPIIEQTIASLDVPVAEVLIELEMLDISKGTSELMGVKFGKEFLAFAGASKATFYPFNQTALLTKEDVASAALANYTAGRISAANMSAVVNFLKTRSDTRNLAKPKIMTLNNQAAEIKISTDEAVGVTRSTDSATSTAIATEEAERVQTGVFLTVTPQANLETREILLAVSPKVIQARLSSITVNGQNVRDAEERGAQSLLKVNDGETIVIGGLLREDMSNGTTKVPILGDIPLVGGAFRHKDKTVTQRELIIFITPHIIDDTKPAKPLPLEVKDGMNKQELIKKSLNMVESNR